MLAELEKIERLADSTPFTRFRRHPYRYLESVLYRKLLYPWIRKSFLRTVSTFYLTPLQLLLPAGTDLYLTGAKTHRSELLLAKYLVRNLQAGVYFIDVGAHFGYYSCLAALLTGEAGKVYAFEASPSNAAVLERNLHPLKNTRLIHKALSDQLDSLPFYNFPGPYSEYNTFDPSAYTDRTWYNKFPPTVSLMDCTTLDDVFLQDPPAKWWIKIDVEGWESQVIKGGQQFIQQVHPLIIMEFQASQNAGHYLAHNTLLEWNYLPYLISPIGELEALEDIPLHFTSHNRVSENFVYVHSSRSAS